MSLTVHAFVRVGWKRWDIALLDGEGGGTSAGSESCRWMLWGSVAAVALGLTLLPRLGHQDHLLIERRRNLARLEYELCAVVDNLLFLERKTGQRGDYIADRARNVASACARAGRIPGGGVLIL